MLTGGTKKHREAGTADVDVLIVGAGFSGLYALYKARELGLAAKVIERGGGLGGTWFWNKYPGARVDIESLQYSYSFSDELQQEWEWSERYATQPELLRYLNHVADRFALRDDIILGAEVTKAEYDETTYTWTVSTAGGGAWCARFVIMATGPLSIPRKLDFEGLEDFGGRHYTTSQWPEQKVDLSGARVGLIGTGSTGIQLSQVVAKEAKHLTVFQRTPNFSVPAGPLSLDPERVAEVKRQYREFRRAMRNTRPAQRGRLYPINERTDAVIPADRERAYEERWRDGGFGILETFSDIFYDLEANEHVAEFARRKIREIVKDPAVAGLLIPQGYPFGSKRLCVDLDYYATFNRDNVTLVDVRANSIDRIVTEGLRLANGTTYPLDVILFATGFDAETGALLAIDIRGRGGASLRDKWQNGPITYLGLMSRGFPNLFMVTGPGSPSVVTNMVVAIEQHIEWIFDLIRHMDDHGLRSAEPEQKSEMEWVVHVKELADRTIYTKNRNSWYMGANVEGKPRVFKVYLGGFDRYQRVCDEIAAGGYPGFQMIADVVAGKEPMSRMAR